jgi:hypothetical protein
MIERLIDPSHPLFKKGLHPAADCPRLALARTSSLVSRLSRNKSPHTPVVLKVRYFGTTSCSALIVAQERALPEFSY